MKGMSVVCACAVVMSAICLGSSELNADWEGSYEIDGTQIDIDHAGITGKRKWLEGDQGSGPTESSEVSKKAKFGNKISGNSELVPVFPAAWVIDGEMKNTLTWSGESEHTGASITAKVIQKTGGGGGVTVHHESGSWSSTHDVKLNSISTSPTSASPTAAESNSLNTTLSAAPPNPSATGTVTETTKTFERQLTIVAAVTTVEVTASTKDRLTFTGRNITDVDFHAHIELQVDLKLNE